MVAFCVLVLMNLPGNVTAGVTGTPNSARAAHSGATELTIYQRESALVEIPSKFFGFHVAFAWFVALKEAALLASDAVIETRKQIHSTAVASAEWGSIVVPRVLSLIQKTMPALSSGFATSVLGIVFFCWLVALIFFVRFLDGETNVLPGVFVFIGFSALPVYDVASASSDCDSIHDSLNDKRGEDLSKDAHDKLRILEVNLDRLNKKQSFVAGGKVIDRATIKTTYAAIFDFLGFVVPLLLAFRPAEIKTSTELCALSATQQIATTKGLYGTAALSGTAAAASNGTCSYDNVTIGSVLYLKTDDTTTPITAHTTAGPLVGARWNSWRGLRDVDAFLSVPYAAPPVGTYRWRPPQPITPWTAPRDATRKPPACPQNPPQSHTRPPPGFPDQEPRGPWSEDCLFVNVWAPSNRTRKLPVLLWLYGGGWQEGDAAQPLFDGRNLTAANDVVLVVVNYRVNVFGFLGTEALAEEEERLSGQRTSGFYGQQDQRAAMVWARDNIAQFGGDPQKVTLWGQSAGASSICYHLLLPKSAGLFQRAIVDSSCDEKGLSAGRRPLLTNAPFGKCGNNLTCMRATPAAALNEMNVDYRVSPMRNQHWFYPLWDKSEFPVNSSSMMQLWLQGAFGSKVPVMFGSTLDESAWEFCGSDCRGAWPKPFNVSVNASDYERVFRAALKGMLSDALVDELVPLYAQGTYKADNLPITLGMLLTDSKAGMGSCIGMNDDSMIVSKFGLRGFLWVHARRPAAVPSYIGACHGTEQQFVFGNPRFLWGGFLSPTYTPAEVALSAEMQAAWVRFADAGDPSSADSPWPAWGADGMNVTRVFDVGQTAADKLVVNYNEARCAVWRQRKAGKPVGAALNWMKVQKNVYAALKPPAPAPPPKTPVTYIQGWNSWDSVGDSVNETIFLAHCAWMAEHLLPFGYDFCILDAGWNKEGPSECPKVPVAGKPPCVPQNSVIDEHGRPLPNPELWPSAGPGGKLGFKPLATKLHSMGLKLGFHFWRGVLPAAVAARSPVLGAAGYTCADIVMADDEPDEQSDPCRSNNFSRGVNTSHPAAQKYYDSLAALWSDWGADLVKVDCNR